jgi:hypothetical protein
MKDVNAHSGFVPEAQPALLSLPPRDGLALQRARLVVLLVVVGLKRCAWNPRTSNAPRFSSLLYVPCCGPDGGSTLTSSSTNRPHSFTNAPSPIDFLHRRSAASLRAPTATGGATDVDVDAGHVSGFVFVSERDDSLETLRIALRFNANNKVKVFSLADIYGATEFGGTCLEDSGCIDSDYKVGSRTIDHSLVYVSTKEPVQERCNPWTVVYKTNLRTASNEPAISSNLLDQQGAPTSSGYLNSRGEPIPLNTQAIKRPKPPPQGQPHVPPTRHLC